MNMNIKNVLVLALVLFLVYWVGTSGYREFNSKKANIKSIKIYDRYLFGQALATNEDNFSNNPTTNEALTQSALMNITDKVEIDEFVNSFQPQYFNFSLSDCKCLGTYSIVFEYSNGTDFRFALAHENVIKIAKQRDWPVGDQAYQWLQKKGLTKSSQQ